MLKNKLSLEDILNEYSPENDGKTGSPKSEQDEVKDLRRGIRSHSKSKLGDGTNRLPNPANEFKPSDLSRSKVSFVNSATVNNLRSAKKSDSKIDGYEGTGPISNTNLIESHTTKIRRMSESTRAKELEKAKRVKDAKMRREATYKRETPNGEYMYIPPPPKRKKRTGAVYDGTDMPENWQNCTDIVPLPQRNAMPQKQTEPEPTVLRAGTASIDLTKNSGDMLSDIDIEIDAENLKVSRKRSSMEDFNHHGDVEDIGRNISDLKSIISSRVTILFACSLLSVYMSIAPKLGLPIVDIARLDANVGRFINIQLLLGIIAMFFSSTVLVNGLKRLFTLKADSDSMAAICVVSCTLATAFSKFTPQLVGDGHIQIYMPVGILSLMFNAFGKMLVINRAKRNFNFISKNFDRHGIVFVEDENKAETLTRGTLGDYPILASMRKTDFLTDFLRYTYSSDLADKFCKRAAPICLIASLIMSAVITFIQKETLFTATSLSYGLSVFTLLISATSCMAISLVVNAPLDNATKKFIRNRGVMLGYQSIDDFYDTNSILVDAQHLFPGNSVKLSGIKLFSDVKVDEALLDAASLTHHAGSVMKSLFNNIVEGNENRLYKVDRYTFEDSMGIGGWINNKKILFGNRELMTSHYTEGMPTKTKEAEFTANGQIALYLSVSGNLAAMFLVDINANQETKYWVQRLCIKNILLVIRSVDPCITLKKLSQMFSVPEEFMKVIPGKLHADFEAETKKAVRLSASMACSGKFSSLAQLIMGTKRVYTTSILGLIMQSVSVVLGFGLGVMLFLASRDLTYSFMSAYALIVYNIGFTAATYLAVSMRNM